MSMTFNDGTTYDLVNYEESVYLYEDSGSYEETAWNRTAERAGAQSYDALDFSYDGDQSFDSGPTYDDGTVDYAASNTTFADVRASGLVYDGQGGIETHSVTYSIVPQSDSAASADTDGTLKASYVENEFPDTFEGLALKVAHAQSDVNHLGYNAPIGYEGDAIGGGSSLDYADTNTDYSANVIYSAVTEGNTGAKYEPTVGAFELQAVAYGIPTQAETGSASDVAVYPRVYLTTTDTAAGAEGLTFVAKFADAEANSDGYNDSLAYDDSGIYDSTTESHALTVALSVAESGASAESHSPTYTIPIQTEPGAAAESHAPTYGIVPQSEPVSAADTQSATYSIPAQSDSGASAETQTLVVKLTPTETGAGSEAHTLKVTATEAETGSAPEAQTLVVKLTQVETGAGVEAHSPTYTIPVQNESGTAVDADLGIKLRHSDFNKIDLPYRARISYRNPYTYQPPPGPYGDEAHSLTAKPTHTDSSTGADAQSVAAKATHTDAATSAETQVLKVVITVTDPIVGTEAEPKGIHIRDSVSYTVTDAVSAQKAVFPTQTDSGSAVGGETYVLKVAHAESDAGASDDANSFPKLGDAETATGTEAHTLVVQQTTSDTASGIENITFRRIGQSEVFAYTEITNLRSTGGGHGVATEPSVATEGQTLKVIATAQSDAVITTDANGTARVFLSVIDASTSAINEALKVALLGQGDSGAGVDAQVGDLVVYYVNADTGSLLDAGYVKAALIHLDAGAGASDYGPARAYIFAPETVAAVETTLLYALLAGVDVSSLNDAQATTARLAHTDTATSSFTSVVVATRSTPETVAAADDAAVRAFATHTDAATSLDVHFQLRLTETESGTGAEQWLLAAAITSSDVALGLDRLIEYVEVAEHLDYGSFPPTAEPMGLIEATLLPTSLSMSLDTADTFTAIEPISALGEAMLVPTGGSMSLTTTEFDDIDNISTTR